IVDSEPGPNPSRGVASDECRLADEEGHGRQLVGGVVEQLDGFFNNLGLVGIRGTYSQGMSITPGEDYVVAKPVQQGKAGKISGVSVLQGHLASRQNELVIAVRIGRLHQRVDPQFAIFGDKTKDGTD